MYKEGTKFKVVGKSLPPEVRSYLGLVGVLNKDSEETERLMLIFQNLPVTHFFNDELEPLQSDVS